MTMRIAIGPSSRDDCDNLAKDPAWGSFCFIRNNHRMCDSGHRDCNTRRRRMTLQELSTLVAAQCRMFRPRDLQGRDV